jgi:hypothetical protein
VKNALRVHISLDACPRRRRTRRRCCIGEAWNLVVSLSDKLFHAALSFETTGAKRRGIRVGGVRGAIRSTWPALSGGRGGSRSTSEEPLDELAKTEEQSSLEALTERSSSDLAEELRGANSCSNAAAESHCRLRNSWTGERDKVRARKPEEPRDDFKRDATRSERNPASSKPKNRFARSFREAAPKRSK